MRYAGSMEDRVHELLWERLESISRLFGQLPDTLEDVWVSVALGRIEDAKKTIDAVLDEHPSKSPRGLQQTLPHSFGGASTGASPLRKVRSRCARMACFMVSMNMPDGSSRARSVSVAA